LAFIDKKSVQLLRPRPRYLFGDLTPNLAPMPPSRKSSGGLASDTLLHYPLFKIPGPPHGVLRAYNWLDLLINSVC